MMKYETKKQSTMKYETKKQSTMKYETKDHSTMKYANFYCQPQTATKILRAVLTKESSASSGNRIA